MPTNEKSKARVFLEMLPWLVLPCLLWAVFSVIAATLLAMFLVLWVAIPLGILLGFGATALIAFSEGNTVLEVNVTCAIWLILGLILFPVFQNARNKARHKARQQHVQPQQNSPMIARD